MSQDPAWFEALQRKLGARFQAQPWQVPMLLRASDNRRHYSMQLPDAGARPADRCPLRIASVTKVYVAAALFRLVEQGSLDLAAPLRSTIGDDTAAQLSGGGYDPAAITIAQLMRHTSGLRDHCFSDLFLDRVQADPGHHWTRGEQVAIAMRLGPPLASPGSHFVYSDTGYVILGETVERAHGTPLAEAVPALLRFGELGLGNTRWDSSDACEGDIERHWLGALDATGWDASFDLFGGGGVIATLANVDRFLRAVFNNRVFERPETLAAIYADRATPSDPGFCHNGLMFRGTLYGEDVWAHTGFWGVLAAVLPARGIALAAAFNRSPEQGVYGKDEFLVDFAEAVARNM